MSADDGFIPTLDVSALRGDSSDPAAVSRLHEQIRAACSEVGFVAVTGHGVSPELIRATGAAARRFFALPLDSKLAVAPRPWNATSPNVYRGYFPSSVNGKEGLDIGEPELDPRRSDLLERPYYERSLLPPELATDFRDTVARYFAALFEFGQRLIAAMAASLGGDPARTARSFERPESLSTLRFNYYPPLDAPVETSAEDGEALACETHVDSGVVTILHQDQRGGLQVRDRAQRWHDVPCNPDAFVVNTGLAFEHLSAGRFAATHHRVLLGGGDRLSIPFFLEPAHDFELTARSFGLEAPDAAAAMTYETFLRRELAKFAEYDREP